MDYVKNHQWVIWILHVQPSKAFRDVLLLDWSGLNVVQLNRVQIFIMGLVDTEKIRRLQTTILRRPRVCCLQAIERNNHTSVAVKGSVNPWLGCPRKIKKMKVFLLDAIFKVNVAVVLADKDEALGDWSSHHKECQVCPKTVVICAVVELVDVHCWHVLVGLDKRICVFVLPLNEEVNVLKVHKV